MHFFYKQRKNINTDKGETNAEMVDQLTPHAVKYVDRITFWVLQWPFAVLSLILEDILFKIGRWVSEIFEGLFTKLSRMLVANAVKGM